jgi:glycosyltransferase involved in cell wall biosynthesis
MKILLINRNNTNTGLSDSISLNLRFTLPLKYYHAHKKNGWEIVVLHELHDDLHLAMKWADRIVVNRASSVRILALLDKGLWKKLIYDIDDNIFIRAEYASNYNHDINKSIYDEYFNNAGLVTVSNRILYKIIRNAYNLKNVKILPIAIHPESFKNRYLNENILMVNGDGIKMLDDKRKFISEINTFFQKNNAIKLDYIGDLSADIKKIKNLNYMGKIPYTALRKYLSLNQYKCSLVPLSGDSRFDDCKSPIKYYQNGIFGICGIYSNKPVYSSVINSNKNGILINNSEGNWLEAIEKIYENNSLRQTIIENAYEDVNKNNTFNSCIGLYREIFS